MKTHTCFYQSHKSFSSSPLLSPLAQGNDCIWPSVSHGHRETLDSPSIIFPQKAAEAGVQQEGRVTGHREQLCPVSNLVVACSSASNILIYLLLQNPHIGWGDSNVIILDTVYFTSRSPSTQQSQPKTQRFPLGPWGLLPFAILSLGSAQEHMNLKHLLSHQHDNIS